MLDRIGIILKEAGMSYKDVVAVQVYLTDIDLFPRMNSVYGSVFQAPPAARAHNGRRSNLASPKAHLEITVTAKK